LWVSKYNVYILYVYTYKKGLDGDDNVQQLVLKFDNECVDVIHRLV